MRKLWIRAMNNGFSGAAVSVALLTCAVMCCQAPKRRFEIATSDVAAAMVGQGLPAEGLTVKLPASITSSVADPKLQVQSASIVNAHEARLRISCETASECLPFLVTATWPTLQTVILPERFKHAGASTGSHALSEVRVGAPVTLELVQGPLHIKLQVICLESGAKGDNIRVMTKDHKQSYVAEIVNSTFLKGSL